jgi:hypothetical protein
MTITALVSDALEGLPSLLSVGFDLADVGYAVHEHLASGTAVSYAATGPFETDGRWDVEPATSADYTTRFVVHRPTDPARANGTVLVEWLNVTGGLDVPAIWMPTQRHLVRTGCTWVGVTTQRVGVVGGGMMPGMGLLSSAPDRYAMLEHPGDAFSFDLFTQVARAVRSLLPEQYGIPVERVFGVGASQSAFHLTTYVNAIDPLAQALDGFLLQGRAGAAAPLEGWKFENPDGDAFDPEVRRRRLHGADLVRADVRVPVMVVQSETDVFGMLASLPARRPDDDRFRLWEIAGAAHCDTYFLCAAPMDSGSLAVADLAALLAKADSSGVPTTLPINSGPQMHYVLQRAVDALERWVRDGVTPPTADRLAVGADGGLRRDDFGIGTGGIRTPWVDAPLAVLSGLGQPADMTELFGTTQPLDTAALAALYPGGRDDYGARFRAATRAAVDAGFLLAEDADEIEGLGAAAAWPGS